MIDNGQNRAVSGVVSDIQRFSLHDGPGIRTTVFFKGCNARCAWCHNPETLSMAPEVLVSPGQCICCGACVGFDETLARQGLPPARDSITPDMAAACFSGALRLCGSVMTVQDVMDQIIQDRPYYEQSGGGMTASGGECMLQRDFLMALLSACRDAGIHTAIETNLLYDAGQLKELLPLLDLVMADIKLLDETAHLRYTGRSNAHALRGARRLAQTGIPMILRTPVIPGVNDSPEDITAIAQFVANLGGRLLYYELLNYNPLGGDKYSALGMENPFRDARPLPEERMQALLSAAEQAGIPVRAG